MKMNKYVVLILLCIPVVAFAAPSVRVLGEKTPGTSNTNTHLVAAKPVPVNTAVAPVNTSGQRLGTVPVKANNVVNKKVNVGTEAKFPSITSNHVYTSVGTPKQTGGTTVIKQNADLSNYYNKDEVDNKVENYYNKTEVDTIINSLKPEEDPRVDMVFAGTAAQAQQWKSQWENGANAEKVGELKGKGYVFMWVEE